MSKEILVAIISGIAGLVGGSIAWIQAIRTSRLKAEADAALEKIKSQASLALEEARDSREKRKRAFEVAVEESRPVEVALAQAWHDIQSIKDVISKYTSGFRFDVDSARHSLSSSCATLSEGYARWGTAAPDNAKQAWHNAKGCGASVEILLDDAGGAGFPLPADLTERLKELRTTLTDSQMAIAADRDTVRDVMMKKILELV